MKETMDDCVGLNLKKLKDLGLDEKTLVIFTSDNGGLSVLEFAGGPSTHNTPYRGGKGYLYEGGLREPTIVRWPGKIKPAVIDTPIVNYDLLPTLVTLAGGQVPAGLDGVDIGPLLLAGTKPAERKLYWHFPHYNNQGGRPAGAVRDGNWKYISYYDTGETQLFDLQSDVEERNNLAEQQAGQTARLKRLHDAWLTKIDAQRNTPNPDFDPALFTKLYIDYDPSRPVLRPTAAEMEKDMQPWRAIMNEVVAGARGAKGKKGKAK
jgi:arylsulfatase A-like enzyme